MDKVLHKYSGGKARDVQPELMKSPHQRLEGKRFIIASYKPYVWAAVVRFEVEVPGDNVTHFHTLWWEGAGRTASAGRQKSSGCAAV
jgi:hypothetical protein